MEEKKTHYLEKLLDFLKMSPASFAKSLGYGSPNKIYYILRFRNGVSSDVANDICKEYPNVIYDWLMTGEGEMLKEGKSNLPVVNDVVYFVPLLPISAQGGSLSDFIVSVKDSDCEMVVSPIKGADFAITVAGDSMAPEYPNGSQVLIKKINEKAFIDWGKVYVLDTCNGSVIKILVPSEKENHVRCLSINPDPKFAPFDIAHEDIYGVYRVMLCMSVK